MVIKTGLEAIAKNVYAGLETVVFCGFTHEEQRVIGEFVAQGFSDLQIYRTVPRGQGLGTALGCGDTTDGFTPRTCPSYSIYANA